MIGAFTQAQASSKTTYSNIPLSALSQVVAKHMEMGREVAVVQRQEKNEPRKPRCSIGLLVSSSLNLVGVPSAVETSPATKRRWYQTPLLWNRNRSMQNIRSSVHMIANAPAPCVLDECASSTIPVITIGHERSSEIEAALGPSIWDTRRYAMVIEGYSPQFSRSSPSISNGFLGAQTPWSTTTNLFNLPNITSSTLQTSVCSVGYQKSYVDEDEEDESGRILLTALGVVEEPSDEQLPNTAAHSVADTSELQEDSPPPTGPLATQHCPIPSRRQPTRVPTLDAIRVPAPLDLHDAFTYVFGSTIRSSMIAHAEGAPPPYALRQCMILNPGDHESQTTHEDIPSRGPSPGIGDLAPVAPLSVQRRGEKQAVQRRWAVENQ